MALNGYINRRVRGFGLTLIVMGISFLFYYLGLFGGVSGPLNPGRLGDLLADLGVTRTHITLILAGVTLCALSWNWVYNLTCQALGLRLTCAKPVGDEDTACAAPVRVLKVKDRKTGRPVKRYVCPNRHMLPVAHFHPVEKGLVGHTVWLFATACLLIFLAAAHGIY